MENNNGYYSSNNSSNGNNEEYRQYNQYDPYTGEPVRQKKKKKGLSAIGVVAIVLAALIVGISAGSLITYFSAGSSDKLAMNEPAATAAVTEEQPQSQTAEEAPADTGTGSQASEGLSMGASSVTAASGTTLQESMATIVGIETESGSGSGVIVTSDGYIATNNHVISGASTITVYLQDGTEYGATLIGADSYTDLAVVKIEAANLPAATLGDSSSVTVGSSVYAIGNPLGVLACSVSSGIISGLDRTVEIDGISMTLMQTDAAVNPGNSGGGLFSSDGTLIGIINAKSTGLEVEGLGFAIPIDSAKPIIADLMDYGYVTGRPYVGINMQNISMTDSSSTDQGGSYGGFSTYGGFMFGNSYVTRAMIIAVAENSPAYDAGLQVNDIILAIDGTDVQGYTDFSVMLYEYEPGDVVTLTIQRENETMDIEITLGSKTA